MILTEAQEKTRARILRDAYSTLFSFKEGASAMQVERRMDETLGYDYRGKYHTGGFDDMQDVLLKHDLIRRNGSTFNVIPTEETAELHNLIQRQKTNKKRKGSTQKRRPATSMGRATGFRPASSARSFAYVGARRSPQVAVSTQKPMRPQTSFNNYYKPTEQTGFGCGPSSGFGWSSKFGGAASSNVNNNSSGFSGFGSKSAFPPKTNQYDRCFGGAPTAPAPKPLLRPVPKPLVAPVRVPVPVPRKTLSSLSSGSSLSIPSSPDYNTTKPAEPSKCNIPSVAQYAENCKKMFVMNYPAVYHMSELNELYEQTYNQFIDPVICYSKNWKMLATTTFKDFLMANDESMIKLRKSWYDMHSNRYLDNNAKVRPATAAANIGARNVMISPTDEICTQMKDMAVSRKVMKTPDHPPGLRASIAEEVLVTPERPPGISRNSSTSSSLSSFGSHETIKKGTIEYSNTQLERLRTLVDQRDVNRVLDVIARKVPLKRDSAQSAHRPSTVCSNHRVPDDAVLKLRNDLPQNRLGLRALRDMMAQAKKDPVPLRAESKIERTPNGNLSRAQTPLAKKEETPAVTETPKIRKMKLPPMACDPVVPVPKSEARMKPLITAIAEEDHLFAAPKPIPLRRPTKLPPSSVSKLPPPSASAMSMRSTSSYFTFESRSSSRSRLVEEASQHFIDFDNDDW